MNDLDLRDSLKRIERELAGLKALIRTAIAPYWKHGEPPDLDARLKAIIEADSDITYLGRRD